MFPNWQPLMFFSLLLAVTLGSTPSWAAESRDPKPATTNTAKDERILQFDTMVVGHRTIVVEITLPDGGKVTRVTEPLPGRDGQSGMRRLKGYSMPNGTLVECEIRRNTDGTVSVLDVDPDGSHIDRHEKRMSEKEFVDWVKSQE